MDQIDKPRPIAWEGRAVKEVVRDLNRWLAAASVEPEEYGFSDMTRYDQDTPPTQNALMPEGRWLICYPVRGGSEGWYVHLAALIDAPRYTGDGTRTHKLLALAKTWHRESAVAIAQAVTTALDLL